MEIVLLELGQTIQVHERDQCIGQWCVIHHPMPGPWSSWPRWWREDRQIMERICPCGIGHPVAEMYQWAVSTDRTHLLVHGCCNCACTPLPPQEDETAIIPLISVDGNGVLELRKYLLDTMIGLWPKETHANVVLSPDQWGRLRDAILAAYDALEELQ